MIQNLLIRAVGFANFKPSLSGIAPMNNGMNLTNSKFVQHPETGSRIDNQIVRPISGRGLPCMVVAPSVIRGRRTTDRDRIPGRTPGQIRGRRKRQGLTVGRPRGSTGGPNVRRWKHPARPDCRLLRNTKKPESHCSGFFIWLCCRPRPVVAVDTHR